MLEMAHNFKRAVPQSPNKQKLCFKTSEEIGSIRRQSAEKKKNLELQLASTMRPPLNARPSDSSSQQYLNYLVCASPNPSSAAPVEAKKSVEELERENQELKRQVEEKEARIQSLNALLQDQQERRSSFLNLTSQSKKDEVDALREQAEAAERQRLLAEQASINLQKRISALQSR